MSSSSATPAAASSSLSTASARLSGAKPSHYALTLVPNLSDFIFQGFVVITLDITNSSTFIECNSAELTYPKDPLTGKHRVLLNTIDGVSAGTCISVECEEEIERARFNFDRTIPIGRYLLTISYHGTHNDKLHGFYRSKYKGQDGSDKYMVASQMEATDCRRAVPCWDEPALKATFAVTIISQPNLTVLSNMPVLRKATITSDNREVKEKNLEIASGSVLYEFDVTPLMSTYLLAFVVGEFDYISTFTEKHIEIRVYTPVGKTELGRFALNVAKLCLEYYEHYFNIPYPLPKMDLIAIPDFAMGAMENWGLITYREASLLIDPARSSTIVKQRVAKTVCHELAHMWFGNLVTMEWWTYLWLNEGFATFMEYFAVDKIFPEWEIWSDFVFEEINNCALEQDALDSSHPIEVHVHHAHEVNEIFDDISYAKGASVIKMLHGYLGDENFRHGMELYFKTHTYKNTVTADLWNALAKASKQPVELVMKEWVGELGFPVLHVKQTKQNDLERILTVKQQRFRASGKHDEATSWAVPIVVGVHDHNKTEHTTMRTLLFQEKQNETELKVEVCHNNDIVHLNSGAAGCFRISYDEQLFSAICTGITKKLFSAVDRLSIQCDTWSLAEAGGIISIEQALDIAWYLKEAGESNVFVCRSLATSIRALADIHRDQPYYPKVQAMIVSLFLPHFERLGWAWQGADTKEHHDPMEMLFRSVIISMLALGEYKPVIEQAIKQFWLHSQDPAKYPIPADLRPMVYSIIAKHEKLQGRTKLLTMYESTDLSEEKNRLLGALGNNNDVEFVTNNIEFAFSEKVRTADSFYLLRSISSSGKNGRHELWAYYKKHFKTITEKLGWLNAMILENTMGSFVETEVADNMQAFFNENPLPKAQRAVQKTMENIRRNAVRLEREQQALVKWLNKHNF